MRRRRWGRRTSDVAVRLALVGAIVASLAALSAALLEAVRGLLS